MSSFTIDAILGKRQDCKAIGGVQINSGRFDEERINDGIGEFFYLVAMNYLLNKSQSY